MTTPPSQPGKSREEIWRSLFAGRGLIQESAQAAHPDLCVTRLEMAPGRISAGVADKAKSECEVAVSVPVWTDGQWSEVIDLLSRQALFAAQMLANDFPAELEPALQEEGLSLFPSVNEAVSATCSCCEPNRPKASSGNIGDVGCPHISLVLTESGAMVAEDAWLLFLLRGRVREQVLRALRRKRRQNGNGNGVPLSGQKAESSAHDVLSDVGQNQEQANAAKPLTEEVHSFWGSARVQEQFRPHIVAPMAELMLLNRLGPPAFSHANEEVFDTLASVYRRVTESAIALAYAEDTPEEGDDSADQDSVPKR